MKETKGFRSILDRLEKNFAAAGLAEGDPDVAREYIESVEGQSNGSFFQAAIEKIRNMVQTAENTFAAAAMAEGGPELAIEFLENREPQTEASPSLNSFLKDIGLQGIRVQYGVATV